MAIAQKELENILRSKFPKAEINVVDLVGDENHYSVIIKDKIFANKTKIAQHRIGNEALKDLLVKDLHAMQLKTEKL